MKVFKYADISRSLLCVWKVIKKRKKQAEAVLGQAQLKLGLDFTAIQLFEYTNFPFYSILIRLEIAELAIASYS